MSNPSTLEAKEIKALNELFTIWGTSCQEILSTISSNNITLKDCSMKESEVIDLETRFDNKDTIIQELTFSGDLLGSAFYLLKKDDTMILLDLIIGGDGMPIIDEFGDLQKSIFMETSSQMVNSLIGIIANNVNKKVSIMPRDISVNEMSIIGAGLIIELTYLLEIEGKLSTSLSLIFPPSLLKSLALLLFESQPPEKIEEKPPVHAHTAPEPTPVITQPAVFSQLAQPQEKSKAENIDLILDIPVSIKAVLGKSELTVRELIEMSPGKVLELDKMAGEPVDLIVNDRLVAHGEIIVVDEKFGVKVMNVLSKAERIYNLK
ncbi:MAG: flagellar motor switch protein FliN [Vulcanimicrobiota bacterium]